MKVREIMNKTPVVVRPEMRVRDVLQTMVNNNVTGVAVVTDEGKLLGFIPERKLIVRELSGTGRLKEESVGYDYHEYVERQRAQYGRTAAEIMNRNVISLQEGADVLEGLELMLDHKVTRVPVLRGDVVVGELSRTSVLRSLLEMEYQREGLVEREVTDGDLLQRVNDAIRHQMQVTPIRLQVKVERGNVYLNGLVSSVEDMRTLEELARGVPGVRDVVNSMLPETLTQ